MNDDGILYQGGNVDCIHPLLKKVLPDICAVSVNRKISLLNLGSGISFAFEQELCRRTKNIAKLVCIDRLPPPPQGNILLPYMEYKQMNIEQELFLEHTFDFIIATEVIEHIDHTDILLKNAWRHLAPNGSFLLAAPNLASFLSRMELLFGFQPHLLEVSNETAVVGTGIIGRMNNSGAVLHHIRGITYKAMKELLLYHHFKVKKVYGRSASFLSLFDYVPSLSSDVLYVCKKSIMDKEKYNG